MKNTMKAMNDDALELVTGGNNGDSNIEKATNVPFFSVGQEVEVYLMHYLHIHTKHGVILEVKRENSGFLYTVIRDDNLIKDYYADDIER